MTHGKKAPTGTSGHRVTHPHPPLVNHYDTQEARPISPAQGKVTITSAGPSPNSRQRKLDEQTRIDLVGRLCREFDEAVTGHDLDGQARILAEMDAAGLTGVAREKRRATR